MKQNRVKTRYFDEHLIYRLVWLFSPHTCFQNLDSKVIVADKSLAEFSHVICF